MTTVHMSYPNYKMFPYEEKMVEREVYSLFGKVNIEKTNMDIKLLNLSLPKKSIIELAEKITFIERFSIENHTYQTKQNIFEKLCEKSGNSKRQSTRYGAHGLHEYKGKFNPQIVSSIINILGLSQGDKLLEPFCGSGTTLLEASYRGIDATGFDLNPLAVFIANTKIGSHRINSKVLESNLNDIINSFAIESNNLKKADERLEYLSRWFDEEQLINIEKLHRVISKIDDSNIRNTFFCIASNLLRDYSLQEPKDLRIRRRSSEMPKHSLINVFERTANSFVKNIYNSQDVIAVTSDAKAYNIDIRNFDKLKEFKSFNAAITSPPYATALPYIDTQRLSLVWLGMILPKQIKMLEQSLIGSRELSKSEQHTLDVELKQNSMNLPQDIHELNLELLSAVGINDGFRRQAMPYITYRYFADMMQMFTNVKRMLKTKGRFALVVGHNHTTLGGQKFDLDTPNYLVRLAESNGWKTLENIPLETYHRYGLHSTNSINNENLIIFESLD